MSQVSRISGVDPWRTLEALSFYRAAACVAMLVLAASDYRPPYFQGDKAALIDALLFIYLFVAAVLLVLVRGERPQHRWQAALQIGLDIGFLIFLDYATGGIGSGLATLLVTPIAAGSLLLDRRLSSVPPAVATIALLLVELYLNLEYRDYEQSYTQTGMLGAGLFIIAAAGSALARRARESEARAIQAQDDLAKLAALSETVIQKLQAGVLTCNANGHIELMNRAARNLLGERAVMGAQMASCAPQLWQRLSLWQNAPAASTNSAITLGNGQQAWAQFTRLGRGNKASTLVVLDEASRVAEQAQSMKLASLGRLTASIAHELRNPLSAIQHAAELARESNELAQQDRALVDIIHRQSGRLEGVIGSVLSLSRKSTPPPEPHPLAELLRRGIEDFQQSCSDRCPSIELEAMSDSPQVLVEPAQFEQILHNLLENARIHGQAESQQLTIHIDARLSSDQGQVLVDLRDNGRGIPKDIADHVFDPFFSTHHQHTGLGLFITRELCLAANGDLHLIQQNPSQGAWFQISLPAEVIGS